MCQNGLVESLVLSHFFVKFVKWYLRQEIGITENSKKSFI